MLASTKNLSRNPKIHALDKYRKQNDGSFRAYEIYHYRIAYHVTDKEIIILRVRHTSMEPKDY
ncbi:type II toxin-antitoxin system RelE/ParE family toxin [Niabella insulamsoli]|uniref:type II toxin-antitoxin system RelE/ParE family toxin n=1 Tax=Niabella insulamsoli TaxID=3144874 RepID=UPI003CCC8936